MGSRVDFVRRHAEFGQSASGMINAVTRTGGNVVEVEAFTLYRDRALNARGVFEATKPDYDRVHIGVAAGFPINRDRTHACIAAERRVENLFKTVDTNGVFPTVEGTFKTPIEQHLLSARLDHQASARDELMVRFVDDFSSGTAHVGPSAGCSLWGGQVAAEEYGLDIDRSLVSALASYRRRTGDTGVSESRVEVMRFEPRGSRRADEPAVGPLHTKSVESRARRLVR